MHHNNPRRFSFLHLAKNGGKAEAVRQGMLAALQSGADYVGFWDADLATPLVDVESFCRVLDAQPRVELVIGTRMRLLGHTIDRRPLRYWLGRLFANVASLALGLRVFDTQCGAKLFRATPRLAQLFERPFLTRWIFDVEILARMHCERHGAAGPQLRDVVYEYPLDSWCDVAGSSVKRSDFVKAAGELAKIYWHLFATRRQLPARRARDNRLAARPTPHHARRSKGRLARQLRPPCLPGRVAVSYAGSGGKSGRER